MTGRVSLPKGTKAPIGEGAAAACCDMRESANARTGIRVNLSIMMACEDVLSSSDRKR